MTQNLHSLIAQIPDIAKREKDVPRGEYLFRQQQSATAIFVVISGRIRLCRDLPDGSTVTLHVARCNETFAEAALFANHYHCHAMAEVDSHVLCINSKKLLQALAERADLGFDFSQLLAAQVRDLRTMLSLRDIRSAEARLLAWLRMQASGNEMEIPIDRSWTGISEELGLTKEAVYRGLSKLQSKGLIKRLPRQGGQAYELVRLCRK